MAAAAHVADIPDGLRELHPRQRWDLFARARLPTLQDALSPPNREQVPALVTPLQRHAVIGPGLSSIRAKPAPQDARQLVVVRLRLSDDVQRYLDEVRPARHAIDSDFGPSRVHPVGKSRILHAIGQEETSKAVMAAVWAKHLFLRSWTLGRPYPTRGGRGHSRAIIRPASATPPVLSFWNLIEAHVLRALRTDHGVTLSAARKAADYAEKEFGIDRLLLSPELKSSAGHIVFADMAPAESLITIDPTIAFGRPILVSRGVSTETIAARIDAGEDAVSVAEDYGLSNAEIEHAVNYERAA